MPNHYLEISNTFCIYFLLTLHMLSVQGQWGRAGLYADEHNLVLSKDKKQVFESYRGVYWLDCPEDLKIPPLTWVAAVFMRQSL